MIGGKLSPVGTAENSPGRESWVGLSTAISPVGTTENAPGRQSWVNCPRIIHFRGRGTPGLHPGAFSASPYGTGPSLLPKPRTSVLGYSQPSLRDSIWRGQYSRTL